jgi:tRNA pseudouridine55 synthase
VSGIEGHGFAGLLAMDKPTGVTSHDVVLKVRRRLRSPGAGHLGTLDPGASGLLMVAMGAATRAIPVWQGGEKTYEGRAVFGVVTASQDLEGEILERRPTEALDPERLLAATTGFVGDIEQIPPMVSALKVGGQRLHRLARRGLTVERAPRRVCVLEWEWLEVSLPEAAFRIRCTAGTYVRTLIHDVGLELGTGAALASLRRTRSEPFGLDHALSLGDLDRLTVEQALAAAIPLDRALDGIPEVVLDEHAALEIGAGGRPRVPRPRAPLGAGPRSVVMRSPEGRALALGELVATDGAEEVLVCPHVVFPWAVRVGRRTSAATGSTRAWEALSERRA